mgnify:CR=1 FL=1
MVDEKPPLTDKLANAGLRTLLGGRYQYLQS